VSSRKTRSCNAIRAGHLSGTGLRRWAWSPWPVFAEASVSLGGWRPTVALWVQEVWVGGGISLGRLGNGARFFSVHAQ
jgi:hypothetical protein